LGSVGSASACSPHVRLALLSSSASALREHGGKESMRQPRRGSIVAALDEFEISVAKKAVQHRARQISTAEAARWCGPQL